MPHNGYMKIDDSATVWAGQELSGGTPLLLIMHGYGANERDLLSLVEYFPTEFAAACLRAPLPIPQFPGGYAWFPIAGSPAGPGREAADTATAAVLDWLEEHATSTGPIILLGFSQGGAMVTHLLRTAPERFAAGVVLSGFTVPGDMDGDAKLAEIKPPVFFGYDPLDPIVPGSAFLRTREFGADHFTLTSNTYRVAHGINAEEIADINAFLTSVLTSH